MKRFLAKHSPLFILAGLCVALAIVSEDFRQPGNVQQVAARTCVLSVIAMGELLVILIAGIDLSVGSVAALSGVVAALSMTTWGMPMGMGIVMGSLAGLSCGLVNGLLVTRGGIPPFIATLGMMMVARGLTLILSGGVTISGLPDSFLWLGGTMQFGGGTAWWVPVIVACTLVLFFVVVLSLTPFGRALYAIGGNLKAARLSGLKVNLIRTLAFGICGLLAGFGGVMLTSRTSVATANAAEMYELDAIASCVIGGASLMGGEGGALGALSGALILKVLRNFCNLMNIDAYWQQVFVGVLVVVLVFYDNLRKRRAGLLQE